jgi:SWIM zinc finger
MPSSAKGKAYFKVIYKWLFSFTDAVESKREYLDSRRKLEDFLEFPPVVEALGQAYAQAVREWLAKSFFVEGNLKGLLFYHRKHVRDFGLRTTCNAESEGSALKRSAVGPKPNHSIDTAVDATIKFNDRRSVKHNSASAAALDATWLSYYDHPVYSKLTPPAAKQLKIQFDDASNYCVFCPDGERRQFFVKRSFYHKTTDEILDPWFYQHVVPSYERTRVVDVCEDSAKCFFLRCSCGYFDRFGIVCRHQYAVLRKGLTPARHSPQLSDVAVRWQTLYGYYYGRKNEEKFTKAFDAAIENEACGAHVELAWLQENYSVGHGNRQESFFTRSLDSKPVQLRESNWWNAVKDVDISGLGANRENVESRPFGTDQFVHLSAAAQASQRDWDEDSEGPGCPWDVEESGGSFERNPDPEAFASEPFDYGPDIRPPSQERLAAIRKTIIAKEQYSSLHPIFAGICDLCVDANHFYVAAEKLKALHKDLLAMNAQASSAPGLAASAEGGAAASLPRLATDGGALSAADAAPASVPAVAAAAAVSAPGSAPGLAASAGRGTAATLPRLAADGGASSAADAAPASVPAVAAAEAVSAPALALGLAASAEGGAAATAISSEALADGLEDNGALAGGAPIGQDLSHHLLSGGMASYIQLDTSRKHKRRKAWHEFKR